MDPTKTLLSFLNKRVLVKTKSEFIVEGELVHVDRSEHGNLGNVIIRNNGALNIIRGDAVQFIGMIKTEVNRNAS